MLKMKNKRKRYENAEKESCCTAFVVSADFLNLGMVITTGKLKIDGGFGGKSKNFEKFSKATEFCIQTRTAFSAQSLYEICRGLRLISKFVPVFSRIFLDFRVIGVDSI